MKNKYIYIAWGITLLATAGSLFMSTILHWEPCILCWFQRIFMFPLFVIFTTAIIKEIRDLDLVVLPLTIVGFLISFYHTLLMYGIFPENLVPCTNGVSCSIPYHLVFSFVTVPLLSLFGFITIMVCTLLYRKEKNV